MAMGSQPFKRAIALQQQVQAVIDSGKQPLDQQAAIDALPAYESRGHGEGCSGNKHAKSSFKQNKRRGL